jgi:hypothetical protein
LCRFEPRFHSPPTSPLLSPPKKSPPPLGQYRRSGFSTHLRIHSRPPRSRSLRLQPHRSIHPAIKTRSILEIPHSCRPLRGPRRIDQLRRDLSRPSKPPGRDRCNRLRPRASPIPLLPGPRPRPGSALPHSWPRHNGYDPSRRQSPTLRVPRTGSRLDRSLRIPHPYRRGSRSGSRHHTLGNIYSYPPQLTPTPLLKLSPFLPGVTLPRSQNIFLSPFPFLPTTQVTA